MNVITKSMKVLLLLLLISFFNIIAQAQDTKVEIRNALTRVMEAFSYESYSMSIEYEQLLLGEEEFRKVDECKMIKNGNQQHVIFKSYETLVDESIYVKVNHVDRQIYLIRATDKSPLPVDQTESWKFSEETLLQYRLEIDTIKSSIEEGYVVYKSLKNSTYSEVVFKYDPVSLYPTEYIVFFNKSNSNEFASIRTRFEDIIINNKQVISKQNYFELKGTDVVVNDKFKNYQLIKNF
jgi:hypothetical protein